MYAAKRVRKGQVNPNPSFFHFDALLEIFSFQYIPPWANREKYVRQFYGSPLACIFLTWLIICSHLSLRPKLSNALIKIMPNKWGYLGFFLHSPRY